MFQNLKRYWMAVLALIIVGAVFLTGVYIGYTNRPEADKIISLVAKEDQMPEVLTDFSPFWKAWRLIDEKYVPVYASSTKPVTDQDRIWGAISGLVSSLGDPYSTFMPPQEYKEFQTEISGKFSGVGIEIGIRDDALTVIAPLKGTPAYRAGIKAGDKVTKIDNKETLGMKTDEAVKLIRGEEGTTVTLTITREGIDNPKEFKLTRENIQIPTLETELRADRIFVIRLFSFSETAPNLFRDALQEFVKQNEAGTADKIILDLRGNPGGYLEAAVDIASWFLPAGDVVVRESFGHGQPENVHRSHGYNIFNNKLKMVILVDKGSASASEILAGALQEHGVAKLVGEKTFGKGSVQELVPVTSDASLKITVARWLTPNGVSISASGLTPDVVVKIDAKPKDETDKKSDPVLDAAVKLLLQQ